MDSLSWIILSLDLAENNIRNKHKGITQLRQQVIKSQERLEGFRFLVLTSLFTNKLHNLWWICIK